MQTNYDGSIKNIHQLNSFLEKILGSNTRDVRLEHQLCLGRWINLNNHIRELPLLVFLVFKHFSEDFPVSMRPTYEEINLNDTLKFYIAKSKFEVKKGFGLYLISFVVLNHEDFDRIIIKQIIVRCLLEWSFKWCNVTCLNMLNVIFIGPNSMRNSLTSSTISRVLTITSNRRANPHTYLVKRTQIVVIYLLIDKTTFVRNKEQILMLAVHLRRLYDRDDILITLYSQAWALNFFVETIQISN